MNGYQDHFRMRPHCSGYLAFSIYFWWVRTTVLLPRMNIYLTILFPHSLSALPIKFYAIIRRYEDITQLSVTMKGLRNYRSLWRYYAPIGHYKDITQLSVTMKILRLSYEEKTVIIAMYLVLTTQKEMLSSSMYFEVL